VQQVRLANGRRLIYKSQLPPTVEPEFYQAASSALLADHRLLETLGKSRTMAPPVAGHCSMNGPAKQSATSCIPARAANRSTRRWIADIMADRGVTTRFQLGLMVARELAVEP
jgi:hypothetical protein